MKRTQAGPPVAWIWAGVAILAVLLISVLFWVFDLAPERRGARQRRAIVPDVTGMTYERANTELGDADLLAYRVDEAEPTSRSATSSAPIPTPATSVQPGQEMRRLRLDRSGDRRPCPTLEGLAQDAAASRAHGARARRSGTITPRERSRTWRPAP